ncbi:putative NAD-dependent epimerase/dehydratase [Actinoplanes missouriensis 431]|uniref:dTDP-4-dehydrorhamnose reductase n=1 Tax=Actinoplanes missouriensis (strain ATCC 14538 / DSM 43046 / CBS 188.64 / JCM 3121 / NBRC 102363 / NCIMB 12654 / NRRL B-3342 / UNCC 431) TaxID=512565 RepID=I0H600_ACTM4|nr:putative NAD-dependent epimerase/dehydratase [Actinoplanes missouriensis 431]
MSAPVVIVGNGLIGAACAATLRGSGHPVITVARRGESGPGHLSCDLTDAAGRAGLARLLRDRRPARVVLTHGPSDVTWINAHEREAAATHTGVAALVAESGVPAVLVSTDNVFAGDRGHHRPHDPIAPANAYGRIKAQAEQAVVEAGGTALRVSLVYGWAGPAYRETYGGRCLLAAAAGQPMDAPVDQEFTPVHIDDVRRVVAALCAAGTLPGGVAHLAGPAQLSRFAFARLAYRLAGADENLVRQCSRAGTEWATRPRYSSLSCDGFDHLPGLDGWSPMSAARGLALMVAEMPATVGAAVGHAAGLAAGGGPR